NPDAVGGSFSELRRAGGVSAPARPAAPNSTVAWRPAICYYESTCCQANPPGLPGSPDAGPAPRQPPASPQERVAMRMLRGPLLTAASAHAAPGVVEVVADPSEVRLSGPVATWSLLVHGRTADGRLSDLTHAARFRSDDPSVATVNERGVIRAAGDGATAVR